MKRALDLVLLFLALPLWIPAMLILSVAVRIKLGSPLFFRQERPGLRGSPFYIVKFRTMSNSRDAEGNLLPDEVRLTRFGKWLRSTSMDELPEIINVWRGEMSFVGPRPLLMQYLDRYTPRQARRHEVLPGITGWAQVNGRNAISWENKLEMDVWYVEHQSLALDLKILLLTVLKVTKREGISAPGSATTHEFMGSKVSNDH